MTFMRDETGSDAWNVPPKGALKVFLLEPGSGTKLQSLVRTLRTGDLPDARIAVKQNPLRDVHRVEIPESGEVFVKRDRPRRTADRLRAAIRGARAETEARNLQRARSLGIASPEPLLYAIRRNGAWITESVLVTRSLAPCVSLAESLRGGDPGVEESLQEAGRIIRRLHNAGYLHRDLHTGNLLVSSGESARKVCLVDLQKMVRIGWVPRTLQIRDLTGLLSTLDSRQRRLFAEAYCGEPPMIESVGFREKIEAKIPRWIRARLASRSRRCLVSSSRFRVEKFGRAADLHDRLKRGEVAENGWVIKSSSATFVTRQGFPGEAGEEFVAVKSYSNRGPLSILWSWLRSRRGRQAWRNGHTLRLLGLDTPQPIALVEGRRFGILRSSHLLTRWITGSEDLPAFVARYFAPGTPSSLGPRHQAEFARRFGRFVGRLHAAGVYHSDLKLLNFIVSPRDSKEKQPTIAIVDLDSLHFGRELTWRRRIKNLAQIEDRAHHFMTLARPVHRIAFLQGYFSENPNLRRRMRYMIRAVRKELERRVVRRGGAVAATEVGTFPAASSGPRLTKPLHEFSPGPRRASHDPRGRKVDSPSEKPGSQTPD
jgi:tRNA A-37 threonylcarbamoyl transferase component Bud32